MFAVRWHGRGDVRLDDVQFDLPLGPGMVEAEVAWCGICGSDVAEFAHGPHALSTRPHVLSGQQAPLTLGHEFTARVTAVGEDTTGLAVGDRVTADACWRCGNCEACHTGRYNRCSKGGSIGLCSDGAFASHIRFPAYAAVPLTDDVSDRAGALIEPLAVGLHTLERGGATPGDTVVVLGFGPIGAATAAVAQAIGLVVLVSEPNPRRRARAARLGHSVYAPTGVPRDIARELRARTGGGAHVVVDATGAAAGLELACELTRRGGVIAVPGIPKEPSTIDAGRLVLFERSVVGSLGYAHDLPRIVDLIACGQLDAEQLITRTIALADTPTDLARLAEDPGEDIKVLVDAGASP